MSMSKRILIVDDEPDIREFLSYYLKNSGYEIELAENGYEALDKVRSFAPDLVLLDVMMPEMNGYETCRKLREDDKYGNTIIAFLSARKEDESLIKGLRIGADDYIPKPIRPKVLVTKIEALLRRNQNTKQLSKGISVDMDKFVAIRDGQEFVLPKKELQLLALLLSKPGNVFTREQILAKVWGTDVVVGDRTIDVHIRRLRHSLGEKSIETVKGVGYKAV
jgi:two-component system alkaline phosphatase synthesis response regulator PhoP